MKWQLFLAAILLLVLMADVSGEKQRKHKKYRVQKKEKIVQPKEEQPSEDDITMLEADEQAEKDENEDDEPAQLDDVLAGGYDILPKDPCAEMICGAGRECVLNDDGAGVCECIRFCALEMDPRRKVCSNHNETWNSDCELHKMRCICKKGSPDCSSPDYEHVHIEYYGECREMPECTKEEMIDFPRRMRDWLFNIMRDLADRKELSSYYVKLEREAEQDHSQKWANAAIWKWCDLDDHPHDRVVSRHELFPIRAPLLALEHCIGPFLDSCDVNDDHFITLKEWGSCLELEENDLEDKCEQIRDDSSDEDFKDGDQ